MGFKQKGVPAGNTFFESLTNKFESSESNFVLGNTESLLGYPIVYSSDGFTKLTGYQRFEVIGNSCNCSFLYSLQTKCLTVEKIKEALKGEKDFKTVIEFSKKDGTQFRCLLDISLIRNEFGKVVLFLVSHKEIKPESSTPGIEEFETSDEGKTAMTRKSRKFSRDILFHLQKRYQGLSSTPLSIEKKN